MDDTAFTEAIGFSFAKFYRPVIKHGCVGCGQSVEVCSHPSLLVRIVERSMGTVAQHVNRCSIHNFIIGYKEKICSCTG
jgi:hypothetical protein